ncbi:amidohydrolase family protein [Modestobacter sp. I12A-02628]|uniref:Amidohydrolase family protein n=1 Tax=Goekera deserti TaxID=2497753 RepID=A0A7K3WG81_9ACTN|nr:amidohydrolase family protein [Goekera deserti]MPQ99662.1 amidohydrolase family protein [Goekera deserti]NDI46328.1 amidohydrolase family protein [Goekera deserti]NEL54740.1 amidohydrolase family protein [Goekera deserti]
MSLLLTGVTVGDARGRAVHVDGGRIRWVGPAADAPAADRVLDGEGALLTPAFVDAHVHATATGLALTGLDLHSSVSLPAAVAAVRAHVDREPAGVVLGTGWEETSWPEGRGLTRADLDAVVGDRPVYLARVDVHSATVSTALLDRVPGVTDLPGYAANGQLRLDAHHAVRQAAFALVDPLQRRRAQQATLMAAAGLGIGSLHEMAGPEVSGLDDLTDLLALAAEQPGPRVSGYWGELAERGGLDVVRRLGLAGAGGDLFCDGAFGSHTAALSAPYTDRPGTRGVLRFETAQLVHHLRACTAAGVQAGFHCIGDAAVDQVLEAAGVVVAELGVAAVRACRHRLEHVEMVGPAAIERMHAWGMVASVQPAFDAAWGGAAGMYADRLGPERAAACNPLADLSDAEVPLALGSDAPVTPMDPWAGVHAAVDHRTAGCGLRPFDAYDAATHGGWYAVRQEHAQGPLAVGAPADLALWQTTDTLSTVLADRARPICRALLVAGHEIGARP